MLWIAGMPQRNETRRPEGSGFRSLAVENRTEMRAKKRRFDILGYSETVADRVLDWVLVCLLLGCKSLGDKVVEARGVEPLS